MKRPPVLAHLRFKADQASLSNLDLKRRFERIYETNLWGAPTSVSGLGSEEDATATLCRELPALLRRFRISSLLDAPCGDASWILRSDLGVTYTGIDIVPALIDDLSARSNRGEIAGRFLCADLTTDPLPRRDAILSRDCLVHLSYENITRAVANFRNSGAEYLIATTFNEWFTNADIEDGDWRPLNFEAAPFAWPAPLALLNEGCTEGGGAYCDKCLGVWKMETLILPKGL